MLQPGQNLGVRFGTSGVHLGSLWLCPVWDGGSVDVDSLLIVVPIVGFCGCSIFCCALLCVLSDFAITSMGKKELVALLCLSSWCLLIVLWLFLTMPRVCLQFDIVVFPDHTHLLFSQRIIHRP